MLGKREGAQLAGRGHVLGATPSAALVVYHGPRSQSSLLELMSEF